MRDLMKKDVDFDILIHGEHAPIKGNCSAIDEKADLATEEWILQELRSGNDWAWCCIEVKATWKEFEGSDFLGCCSYCSEENFKAPGGYYEDMQAEALSSLNENISTTYASLEELTP